MPSFRVHLHDGPDTPPLDETLNAENADEALALAEMRLLLTKDFTHAVVSHEGVTLGMLHRDSQPDLVKVAAP